MTCRGCGGPARETTYGPWCLGACGGVMYRPGEAYVRHVATAKGEGGEFHILFDNSISAYSLAVQRDVKLWVAIKKEFVQGRRTFLHTGTLDMMIALAQPLARGDGVDLPELFYGTGATADEKACVDETFDMNEAMATPAPDRPFVEGLAIDRI